jgi:hypothetical protein
MIKLKVFRILRRVPQAGIPQVGECAPVWVQSEIVSCDTAEDAMNLGFYMFQPNPGDVLIVSQQLYDEINARRFWRFALRDEVISI